MTECLWTEDYDGVWQTSCGDATVFEEGTPEENHYRFCPYCGGSMNLIAFDPYGAAHEAITQEDADDD